MTFDSSFTDEVCIIMHQYISKVFKEFPAAITGKCATPATDNLYKIRDDAKKLGDEQADAFHHTVYHCSRDYDDDFEREEDERGRARHSMKDSTLPHPSSGECVGDRPPQPAPPQLVRPPQQRRLRARSPSGVAEIWAESGFDPDSDFVKRGVGARQRKH
jgi:hypothetical protein